MAPLPPNRDKAKLPQESKLVGRRTLLHLRSGGQLVDSLLTGKQLKKDAQSAARAEGSHRLRQRLRLVRGQEVELGVAQVLVFDERPREPVLLGTDVGADRIGEVADAPVVRGNREVVATELGLSEGEIASRRSERLGRVEKGSAAGALP